MVSMRRFEPSGPGFARRKRIYVGRSTAELFVPVLPLPYDHVPDQHQVHDWAAAFTHAHIA